MLAISDPDLCELAEMEREACQTVIQDLKQTVGLSLETLFQ